MIASRLRFILARPWTVGDWVKSGLAVALAAAALSFSGRYLDLSLSELIKGVPWIVDLVSRMFPPNWAFLRQLARPVLETIQVAVWGTLLAVVLALPLCFLGARNLAPRWLFHATRQLFNAARGINELIFALIFVAAVGLGPFAGVLALALHTTGVLGRLYAESLENLPAAPERSLREAGSGAVSAFAYAALPLVTAQGVAYALYRLEMNIRMAAVLGFVGAGGLGQMLYFHLSIFQQAQAATLLVAMFVLVFAVDSLSAAVRGRLAPA